MLLQFDLLNIYRNYYGAGSSALNWRENQFTIVLSPGLAVGDPVTIVYVDHPPPSVTLINELTTGPSGSGASTTLYLAPDGTYGYLRGTLSIDSAKNFSIGGAIPNASLYIANELIQGMRWANTTPIRIIYQKDANASDRITLDTYQSPPLSEIIYFLEQFSINLYAEVLVKTIAQVTNSSINNVLPVYCESEHGIEQTAVATMDGSGLSPENRITTWAIAHVLYNVRQRATWFPLFEQALPIINNIRMKSGYIHNVLSYAGYVNNQVFSFITNNFNGETSIMREKIWNLLDTLK
jgi:D-alanyl-D-alanine carboxypeptidase/D-alanyl-D-alanine-endopeptidase (penicillin-binding protein 4)